MDNEDYPVFIELNLNVKILAVRKLYNIQVFFVLFVMLHDI